ncbi:hypothetical protein AB0M72_07115 [Nocardiopsis dassonvillei]
MDTTQIHRIRAVVTAKMGLAPTLLEALHRWALSHVERLTLLDNSTVIFKAAREPFTPEDDALTSNGRPG